MKTLLQLLACVAFIGCGTGELTSGHAVGDDSDALSTSTDYTLRADARACPSPACGGYFLRAVNKSRPEVYVSALDFSRSGLSAADIATVQAAPPSELVLRGKLSPKVNGSALRQLLVTDAFRGMPGRSASGTFYAVHHAPVQCTTSPCNQDAATALNTTASPVSVTTLSVASAAVGFVDEAWLTHRLQQGRAIVAATVTSGAQLPGGTEQVLDATQVFLHVPEVPGPCPALMPLDCSQSGQVNTFTRDENRCLVPTGCAAPGVCSMMLPACADGYTATRYTSAENACPRVVCDPNWILQ